MRFEKTSDNEYSLNLPEVGLWMGLIQRENGQWVIQVDYDNMRASLLHIREEYFLGSYDTIELAERAALQILSLVISQKSMELSFLAKKLRD